MQNLTWSPELRGSFKALQQKDLTKNVSPYISGGISQKEGETLISHLAGSTNYVGDNTVSRSWN